MQSVLQKVPVEDKLGSFTGACDWSMLQISECDGHHHIGAVGNLSKYIQNNQDAVYIVSKFRNATTIASLILQIPATVPDEEATRDLRTENKNWELMVYI